jgi:lipoprotein-anchoring transpeptidase ErfK/SrfK
MVDYYTLLVRAVATLGPNARDQRHALYDRARKTLVEKLRTTDPTLAHTDLKAESAALEAAIQRVEKETVQRAAPRRPNPVRQVYEAPGGEYRDRPPLKDARRRLPIVAGAFGAVSILIASAAIYSYWPSILSGARRVPSQRSITVVAAEPPDAKTNYVRLRQLVYYRTNQPVGTIIVDKTQTFLYVVRPNVSALRYSIGVGTQCTALAGLYHVVRKEELQDKSNDSTLDRMKNQFGARVLYLDNDYRIHGFDAATATGRRLPEGCIRLVNDDVIYLYDHTPLESRVVVAN